MPYTLYLIYLSMQNIFAIRYLLTTKLNDFTRLNKLYGVNYNDQEEKTP